jgi:flagellar basal-body rod protein FlgB
MIGERLEWLGARQRVLSQNVANANTPGYQAKDLRPLDFKQAMRNTGTPLELASTESGQAIGRRGSSRFALERSRTDREVTISGNEVEIESQLEKIADTGMDYQAATNLYRKHIDLLKLAIGRGGS